MVLWVVNVLLFNKALKIGTEALEYTDFDKQRYFSEQKVS